MEHTKQIITRNIPEEWHRKIKVLAAEKGTNINALMLEAIGQLIGERKTN